MIDNKTIYISITAVIMGIITAAAIMSYDVPESSDLPSTAVAQVQVIQPELPQIPAQVPILSVVSEKRTLDSATSIARDVFGVTGDVKALPSAYVISDGSSTVWLFDNGAVKYTTKEWFDPNYETNLTDSATLISIAEDYIAKLRSQGLVPSDPRFTIQLRDVVTGSDTTILSPEGSIERHIIHYMDVNYSQRHSGVEIWGGANDIRVSIGKDGKIIAFYGYWRNLSISDNLQGKISPQEAINSIMSTNNFGIKESIPMPLEKVIVDKITPVYWFDITDDNTFMYPYWGIQGKVVGADGIERNFTQKVRLG